MRDNDLEATFEADRKASESFLNRDMLQLERYAMDQDTQEQHAAAWPHEQLNGKHDKPHNHYVINSASIPALSNVI
jgi:hypothetical protein